MPNIIRNDKIFQPISELPTFFNPQNGYNFDYSNDPTAVMREALIWQEKHSIDPAFLGRAGVTIFWVDPNKGFSHRSRSPLHVAGATGDGAERANIAGTTFIYQYLKLIDSVLATIDTHWLHHVFSPHAHVIKGIDKIVGPGVIISAEDYAKDRYEANPLIAAALGISWDFLNEFHKYYTRELERNGKPPLITWPYHQEVGTAGHALVGIVEEVIRFHTFAKAAHNKPYIKGWVYPEMYSIFGAEVTTWQDGSPIPGAEKNTKLMQETLQAKVIIWMGLALEYCVKASALDFARYIANVDPNAGKKVYFPRETTSYVVIKDAEGNVVLDGKKDGEAVMQKLQEYGWNIVSINDPVTEWPGFVEQLSK